MFVKLSGFNPKGSYLSLEKEKETFCVVFTYSIKRSREIRKIHVAVVQRRLRNVQKSVMHVQSSCFANLNLSGSFLPFSLLSPSSPNLSPIVIIQKSGYHGNLTSHFSSLNSLACVQTSPLPHNHLPIFFSERGGRLYTAYTALFSKNICRKKCMSLVRGI